MKISIRVSILSLFTALLVIVGSAIIATNYYTSRAVILDFASKLLYSSSDSTELYVRELFEPAKQRIKICTDFIKQNIIRPSDLEPFTHFLLQNLIDSPNLYAIYWADVNGNMYLVERAQDNKFVDITVKNVNGQRMFITKQLASDGSSVGNAQSLATTFDPRERPWYIRALQVQRSALSDVYLFHTSFTRESILGVTYVSPVYDSNNKLLGMLAIDIMLDTIAKYVNQLNISKNAVICIFDKANNVLAMSGSHEIVGVNLPKIDELQVPWIKAAFAGFHGQKTLFNYRVAGTQYLAFYDKFVNVGNNDWYIAIMLPARDLIGVLYQQVLFAAAVAMVILGLGMVMVWFIANAISRPIVQLAREAKLITKLEITALQQVKSRIKEIMQMQDAFDNMKQSLRSFACYVPFSLVKKLVASGNLAQVGGENKNVTFLFSDITGFTSLAEKLAPEQLMQYLSEYLQAMTQVVQKYNGTVDKYIGDAVMAFWGAPLDDDEHALHACNAALNMVSALEILNKNWLGRGLPQVKMRIGLNTGQAIIGNIGSKDRLSYTAVGDSVNLANRLEEINKIYHTGIVISQYTYQIVKDRFLTRLLDYTMVRGKAEKIYIYELLPAENSFGAKLAEYSADFTVAFADYQHGNWEQALQGFQRLIDAYPQDGLGRIYLERCQYYQMNPPDGWDGVWHQ